MKKRILPLQVYWLSPDITEDEWDCIKHLYRSGYECERGGTACEMIHQVAAILANKRNNKITDFMYDRITAEDFEHLNELANQFALIFEGWVLKNKKE